jgi:hypothetical protein
MIIIGRLAQSSVVHSCAQPLVFFLNALTCIRLVVVEVVIMPPDPVVSRLLLEHHHVLRLATHLVAFRILVAARFQLLEPTLCSMPPFNPISKACSTFPLERH